MCIAKAALEWNRFTSAVSATSLAALSPAQPGRLSKLGANSPAKDSIRLCSRFADVVSSVNRPTRSTAISATTPVCRSRRRRTSASTTALSSPLAATSNPGSSSCRCQRSRFCIRVRSPTRSSRWSTKSFSSRLFPSSCATGRCAFSQCRTRHCQSVNRVGLAELSTGPSRLPHQLRRHLHYSFTGGQQVALQQPRQMPAVLQRPPPLRPAPRPGQRLHVTGRRRRYLPLLKRASVPVHC